MSHTRSSVQLCGYALLFLTMCTCISISTVSASTDVVINNVAMDSIDDVEVDFIEREDVTTNSEDYSNETTNNETNNETTNKDVLIEIIQSDEYVVEKDFENWVAVDESRTLAKSTDKPEYIDTDKSWFERLIDKILDRDGSDSNALAIFLKTIFILLLGLLFYWVIKNSDSLRGFIANKSWVNDKKSFTVVDYKESNLAQGWESLPTHAEIPHVVEQLIHDNQLLPAASILYRGSLRWLNEHSHLDIKPDNTELQCVNLIECLNSESYVIHTEVSNYVVSIIQHWLPIAYHQSLLTEDAVKAYNKELLIITNDWLITLKSSSVEPTTDKPTH